MDDDSSTKFIESLTKFLQSLCNGYVEFQRGVELVGHIYLSIDTGEKVDYILHEKVNKNDENSVTFVSNSFHALPKEKDKVKTPAGAGASRTSDPKASSDDDDDDDIVILDHTENVLGSTHSGTIPSRNLKRSALGSSEQRRAGVLLHRSQSGGSNHRSPPWRNRQQSGPAATVSSQSISQENISISEVKLEQISSDELLSLASQVGDGATSSQGKPGGGGRSDHAAFSPNNAPGQQVVKQEPMDETQGGLDTGWLQSDSSNSGSNLYPVMMHQNSAAFTSNPMIPGFSTSGSGSSRHGLAHSLPGPSGANPFTNPVSGTSQNSGSMDPSDYIRRPPIRQPRAGDSNSSEYSKKYWQRVRENPEWYERRLQTMRRRARELYAKNKEYYRQKSREHYAKKRKTMAQFSAQSFESGSSENSSMAQFSMQLFETDGIENTSVGQFPIQHLEPCCSERTSVSQFSAQPLEPGSSEKTMQIPPSTGVSAQQIIQSNQIFHSNQ